MPFPDEHKSDIESTERAIQEKLNESLEECERLRAENVKLRERLGLQEARQTDTPQSIPRMIGLPTDVKADQVKAAY